jgi:quinol-cytochrome oxidoreductase complex cytochrome b subunit
MVLLVHTVHVCWSIGLSKSSPRKGIFQKFKSPDLALSQSVVGGVNAKNVTCQYVLIFSVALAALIAVWGVVIAVIIFWALPGDPPKDQDQSQVSNTSTSVKGRHWIK